MDGDFLIHWTARLAVAFYALGLALRLARGRTTAGRIVWTIGYVALLVHLAAAFQFRHDWSNAAAYDSTARQTEEAIGMPWGGGLYVNYVFAIVWGIDIGWWWVSPTSYWARPRWLALLIQGFLAFIVFNAAVVFASGVMRWTSIGVCVLLAALLLRAKFGRA